ncbi:glycoside hydrolase family 26 protein [Actinocorallia sp. A-T 12471]|uniref:glycoside hydrolase family 26 protein n=1 Tax=Actinocorallia sp. A-T 12471 TaxID=3089813 RepID=UPI0029D1494C|nr:glycosyl hydrolase [Actinocorallia sp. A-T 12471]MDX6743527.1 glycosyl hydrolase [Actinocorallia sp. A-T 12471]
MRLSGALRAAAVSMAAALMLAACGDPALDRDMYLRKKNLAAIPPTQPVDIRKLIWPENDYIGLAYDGDIPSGLKRRGEFDDLVGRPHNLLKYFEEFGAHFKTTENKKIWDAGALPFADVEPYEGTLKDFVDGKYDADIEAYAAEVKASNIPLAYSWGHEMNGWWYPWGYCSKSGEFTGTGTKKDPEDIGDACKGESKENTPEDFVAAWRHIHDIFTKVGVGNVIWVWSPNTAQGEGLPPVKEFYPGDEYVDWIGVSGYMYKVKNEPKDEPGIFMDVFGPLYKELRTFTEKPVVIAETGSTATRRKAADVHRLLKGSVRFPDILGYVWFEVKKVEFGNETDFRVAARPDAVKRYRKDLASKWGQRLGFDPEQLINDD